LRVVSSTHKLSFTKSIDSEYVEELTLRNDGIDKVFELFPVDEYLLGEWESMSSFGDNEI
jgi:hypothetical protein